MTAEHRDRDVPSPDGDEATARDAIEILAEEYFERRRRGDRSDAAEFARRIPGREAEFLELVDALAVVESAAESVSRSADADADATREQLGRFRLLRRIGRGGMGIVYEAVDAELDRKVALKVLPGHATFDEREIARFRREAHAAAKLSHPHIVPVFGVGEEAGTHWLALQLIQGESLDRTLRRAAAEGAAPMAPADVARHGIAIAEALAYAHAEGVLHRDVKPSNLLLDRSGTLWITDFGLAKSEGSATITRSGETIGTPRYMAPEAFSGWADRRTDVWGVGATLYELLARRPAFDGADRAQLLKQISDLEPPPLRRLVPSIPRDLATIVTKCLQKEPAARYASATELADDLRRFLAGEPIEARPPSLAYRSGLIARRHPTATTLLLIALAGGIVMTSREAARARAAEAHSRKRFDDLRKLAGGFLFEFHDAIRTLPGSTAARSLVAERALEYLGDLAQESGDDPALRRDLAAAYQKVGDVQGNPYQPNLGDMAGARRSYRTAIELLEPVVASSAATDADRAILASAYLVGGGIELVAGETENAIGMSEKGLALRKQLAASSNDAARRQELATAWQYHAYNLASGNRDAEAMAALREQAAILRELLAASPDDRFLLRSSGQNGYLTARALDKKGDRAAARAAYLEAIAAQRKLLAADPDNTSLRRDLAYTLTDLAIVLRALGERSAAIDVYRETLAIGKALAQSDPENVDARIGVARTANNLGNLLAESGEVEEGLLHLEESVAICEPIVAADPVNAFAERLLAIACVNVADEKYAFGDAASVEEALDQYLRGLEIYERMDAADRLPREFAKDLPRLRGRVGECEARLGLNDARR